MFLFNNTFMDLPYNHSEQSFSIKNNIQPKELYFRENNNKENLALQNRKTRKKTNLNRCYLRHVLCLFVCISFKFVQDFYIIFFTCYVMKRISNLTCIQNKYMYQAR